MEPGRGGERVRRGRGPSPSTTAPPASAGRAAGGKRPERSSEARNRWGGGVGSGDLLRWGCFSVWQLLLAASPLEKGYPPPLGPRSPVSSCSLEIWQGVGGSKSGSNACRCPRPVSCPPAAAGGEGQGPGLPTPRTRALVALLPETSIPKLQLVLGSPAWWEKLGAAGRRTEKSANSGIHSGGERAEPSLRRRALLRRRLFVLRRGQARHQGPRSFGFAAPPGLSRRGKLEEIGAPGM